MNGAPLMNLLITTGCFAAAIFVLWRYLRRRAKVDGSAQQNHEGLIFGPVTPLLASLLPQSEEKRRTLRRELVNAGYYHPSASDNLAAIRYVGIVAPIVLFGVLLVVAPADWEVPVVLAGVVASILGWALPVLMVRSRAATRRDEITQAMPDMLDMLNMCVSQGMTLMASMTRVIRELRPVYPALAHELQIVTEQSRIGSVEQALENFADRVDVPEVHSFTSTLIQTERMGTSVSAALGDHSDNIRESRKQRADQAANTAVLKMLFPTALCLMPAVFLFLLGPAMVDLTEFFQGESGEAFRSGRAAATEIIQNDRIGI